jgi:ABC-type phosphate transport system ATPase subunit
VAYYRQLAQQSEQLSSTLETATSNPSEAFQKQLEGRRFHLREEEAQVAETLVKLKAQRSELLAKNRPPKEVEGVDTLIKNTEADQTNLRTLRTSVDEVLASADASAKNAKDLLPALNRWKAIQKQNNDQYQELLQSAQEQVKLWDRYHDDLKAIVVQHGQKGK